MNEQNQFPAVFHGEINHQSQMLVNARELHGFLQSKQDYSNWIKNRIEQYDFVENQDFLIITAQQNYCAVRNEKGQFSGENRVDYHITLDMAKELAMVERNDMGRKARRYFIDCEKQLKQGGLSLTPPQIKLLLTQFKITQKQTNLPYYALYNAVNAQFKVSHYAQIKQADFFKVIDFLMGFASDNSAFQPALHYPYRQNLIAQQRVKMALKLFSQQYQTPYNAIKSDMFACFGLKSFDDINAENVNDLLNWLGLGE